MQRENVYAIDPPLPISLLNSHTHTYSEHSCYSIQLVFTLFFSSSSLAGTPSKAKSSSSWESHIFMHLYGHTQTQIYIIYICMYVCTQPKKMTESCQALFQAAAVHCISFSSPPLWKHVCLEPMNRFLLPVWPGELAACSGSVSDPMSLPVSFISPFL